MRTTGALALSTILLLPAALAQPLLSSRESNRVIDAPEPLVRLSHDRDCNEYPGSTHRQSGSADVMETIKKLGDTAAHSRMYITKQPDIDRVRFDYGKVISELAHLAGIT